MPVPGGAAVTGPAPGSRRGILVWLPGLGVATPASIPQPVVNNSNLNEVSTMFQTLNNDGWLTVYLQGVGYDYLTNQALGIQNLLNNDAAHGTLYLNAVLHWWDHVVKWIQATYGTSLPIVVGGISWGGWTALTVAANKTSTIAGYCVQVPVTLMWTINPVLAINYATPTDFTAKVNSASNGATLPVSTLNYDTASGTFPSSGSLVIIRGAGGWQILNYTGLTGTTSGTFTGCTGGATNNGNLATGDVIEHSANTSGLDFSLTGLNSLGNGSQAAKPPGYICTETGDTTVGFANAQLLYSNANGAGQPMTNNAVTGGNHIMTNADVSHIACPTWVSGGTYALNSIVLSSSVSYICILAVSGSSTAPGSDATHWSAISGGTTANGWFTTAMNPTCPATH